MSITSLSSRNIKRDWHLLDAKEQILGRLASKVACLLIGKNKPQFVPYLDTGDNVVIINAKEIKVSGKKESQKTYSRYSGYPGGYKEETLAKLRERRPEEILRQAILGMMPKNKLRRVMIKKLHIFADNKHPYESKFKAKGEKE